jgi:two-component system, chemotaxis family, chemotaxis protein CheY
MPFAKHLKVLVVDDTSTSRVLVCSSLNELGITNISIAKDGEEGLKAMMTLAFPLVLSDFEMPKINGLQLLKALREYAPTRQAGFILVSGRGDRAVIEEGRRYGLNNFLPKPFTTASMRTCLEAVVGKLV